jgi:hypothetical protein
MMEINTYNRVFAGWFLALEWSVTSKPKITLAVVIFTLGIGAAMFSFGKTGRTIMAPVSTAAKSSVFGSWWHTPVLGGDLLIDYTELCVTLNQDSLVIPPASLEGGVIKCEDRGYSSGAETIRVAYRRSVPQVRRGFDGELIKICESAVVEEKEMVACGAVRRSTPGPRGFELIAGGRITNDTVAMPATADVVGNLEAEDARFILRAINQGADTTMLAATAAIASLGVKEWHAMRDRDVTEIDATGIAGLVVIASICVVVAVAAVATGVASSKARGDTESPTTYRLDGLRSLLTLAYREAHGSGRCAELGGTSYRVGITGERGSKGSAHFGIVVSGDELNMSRSAIGMRVKRDDDGAGSKPEFVRDEVDELLDSGRLSCCRVAERSSPDGDAHIRRRIARLTDALADVNRTTEGTPQFTRLFDGCRWATSGPREFR